MRNLHGCVISHGVLVALLLSLAAVEVAAQEPPVRLSLRLGTVAGETGAYQTSCGFASAVYGVEVRTAERYFGWAAADHFSHLGGDLVACIRDFSSGPDSRTYVTGGLELDAATRASAGLGVRLPLRFLQLEGTAGLGATHGRPGHGEYPVAHRWVPWAGGAVAIALWDMLILSYEHSWSRLPWQEETFLCPEEPHACSPRPAAPPVSSSTYARWEPLSVARLSVRF